jgi:ethanolamine ammonia-lyase large subunit
MQNRLADLGVIGPRGDTVPDTGSTPALYAAFVKAGGDTRTASSLEEDARQTLRSLRERGFDLGCSDDASDARLETIYRNARLALYARLDDGVLRDAAPRHVRVHTTAIDRDDYLAHPPHGERLRPDGAAVVSGVYASRRAPQVQMVISDGLNANAINGQLRDLLPGVRQRLAQAGSDVGEIDVVVHNGRVRAGYHVGQLVEAEAVVHFIGERPGTGLDTVSAYLTYGRDAAGHLRWSPELDHSWTTAVCGIHPQGKPSPTAIDEIARTVRRMLKTRRSGVAIARRPS